MQVLVRSALLSRYIVDILPYYSMLKDICILKNETLEALLIVILCQVYIVGPVLLLIIYINTYIAIGTL